MQCWHYHRISSKSNRYWWVTKTFTTSIPRQTILELLELLVSDRRNTPKHIFYFDDAAFPPLLQYKYRWTRRFIKYLTFPSTLPVRLPYRVDYFLLQYYSFNSTIKLYLSTAHWWRKCCTTVVWKRMVPH